MNDPESDDVRSSFQYGLARWAVVRCSGVALLLSAAWALAGCSCDETKSEPKKNTGEAPPPEAENEKAESLPPPAPHQLSLLEIRDRCTLFHEGLVLDLGSDSIDSRRMFRLEDPESGEVKNRMGRKFRHFDAMNTDLVFWLTEPMETFEVSSQVVSMGSERMAVYIDGKRLGSVGLKNEQAIEASISGRDLTLEKGRHRLTLALSRPRSGPPAADISWVRIGSRLETPIAPATVSDTFTEVTIGDERLRAIALRKDARIRCPIRVPPRARFIAEWGIWGEGAAEVEIAVITQDEQRIIVTGKERDEEDDREFQRLEADLSPFSSQFVDLEIFVPRALERSQVAFGNPRVVSPAHETEKSVRAKRAIVVVLSGLGGRHLPPLAAENGLPLLNQLSQNGTVFAQYRASTTSIPGIMASLFTGLPPWEHRVEKERDILPGKVVTMASAIEAQGGRTSFFTGVPLSAAPFGFDRGFARFDSIYPQQDLAATEPLDRALKWLKSNLEHQGPVLSFIHLRGGHPPFDVSQEATADLAPKEYGGDLTPRRASLQLAEIRNRNASRNRQMPEEDWQRLFALEKAALLRQNAELGHLVDWLRKRDAYDDTLLIVMGDVGAGERPTIPYSTAAPLSEEALAVPLLIKFPEGHLAGKRLEGWFAPRDVARTLSEALDLETDFGDLDMARESSITAARTRPHMAYREGHYSMLFDSWLLFGQDGKEPRLCEPGLDPTCSEDRSDTQILPARALWLSAWNMLHPALTSTKKEEAPPPEEEPKEDSPEKAFENALTIWGIDR